MLRYTTLPAPEFRHSSGAVFYFRPPTLATKREYHTLLSLSIPPHAYKTDPATLETEVDLEALPPRIQALLALDYVRLPAYLLTRVTDVVDDSGQSVDISDWDLDRKADLLLAAIQEHSEFRDWLADMIADPKKKVAKTDPRPEMVESGDVPELPG